MRASAAGLPVIHMEVGQPSAGAPAAAIAAGHRALAECPQGYWESGALAERLERHYRDAYGLAIDHVAHHPHDGRIRCARARDVGAVRPRRAGRRAAAGLPRASQCAARARPRAGRVRLRRRHALPADGRDGRGARPGARRTHPDEPVESDRHDDPGRRSSPRSPPSARARGIRILSDETYHGITYGRARAFDPRARAGCRRRQHVLEVLVHDGLAARLGRRAGAAGGRRCAASRGTCSSCRRRFRSTSRSRRWTRRPSSRPTSRPTPGTASLLADALAGFGIERIAPPDGAFYLYADVGDLTRDSLAWCRELLDATGVALNTGRDFDGVHGDRFVRISFAVSTAETLRAIELPRRLAPTAQARMTRVLFVCLGNICRSPTAEAVVRDFARREASGLALEVDSAGTHGYHTGEPARRAFDRGGPAPRHRHERRCARASSKPADFERFDLVLAMDEAVYDRLQRIAPQAARGARAAVPGVRAAARPP